MQFFEWSDRFAPCDNITVGIPIGADYSKMHQQPDLVGDVDTLSLYNAAHQFSKVATNHNLQKDLDWRFCCFKETCGTKVKFISTSVKCTDTPSNESI